jgi:hypothetical protein
MTHDEQGYAEAGLASLQLKASEKLASSGEGFAFDLDVRDHNLWRIERMPVFLILFDAARKRAYWLHAQRYFEENLSRRPRKGAKTVRVHVSGRQAVNRRAVAKMRVRKEEVVARFAWGARHA